MGQPMVLTKNGEKPVTVYGNGQAATYIVQGYEYANEDIANAALPADDLTVIPGLTDELAEALAQQGLVTYSALSDAPVKDLVKIKGIGEKKAANLKFEATELLMS